MYYERSEKSYYSSRYSMLWIVSCQRNTYLIPSFDHPWLIELSQKQNVVFLLMDTSISLWKDSLMRGLTWRSFVTNYHRYRRFKKCSDSINHDLHFPCYFLKVNRSVACIFTIYYISFFDVFVYFTSCRQGYFSFLKLSFFTGLTSLSMFFLNWSQYHRTTYISVPYASSCIISVYPNM